MVVSIIEQSANELLKNKPVTMIEYPRLKMISREALGLLWREVRASQKSKVKSQNRAELADKLAEKAEYWEMQKLDADLVRDVQEVVVRRFAALRKANPELF
jgi:hypothetical protein